MTLIEMNAAYSTEDKCLELLKRLRWPDGVTCPRDNSPKLSWLRTQKKFECADCRYQFSVTANTIFHDSHLTLDKWFLATYLMCESRKGISANQLKRILGVSYKTAWYLCHRIRAAVKDTNPEPLQGTVEVDETYVGGKGRGYRGNKAMVLGAIQRGGGVRLAVDRRNDRETLHRFIRKNTAPTTERIMTDEWAAYTGIADTTMMHETVNHRAEEWVRGDVHTNTVEGVFSLFKRSIIGAYHHVSTKHLPAYLDEFGFRFDRRRHEDLFIDTIRHLVNSQTLTFKSLTASE